MHEEGERVVRRTRKEGRGEKNVQRCTFIFSHYFSKSGNENMDSLLITKSISNTCDMDSCG